MDDGVTEQLATRCSATPGGSPGYIGCTDGSGTLGDLVDLVSRP